MPIAARIPIGISVTVITTMRIVVAIGISINSGYPTANIRISASTAFRGSSIPPNIFPESV